VGHVRSELASALHEVSNALTVVLGWLDIARDRTSDGPGRDAIDLALSYARLGHGIARGAIGASAPNAQVERSAAAVARAAVLGVTPAAERRHVTVRLDSTTGVDDLVADAQSASQILLNLLLNAIAFSPEGGEVTLSLFESDGGFVFQVSDEGPGVPRERIATLFDSSRSTREGGAGLGLRHSHALALCCGGDLRLAGPGPRACFELTWPRSDVKSGARHPLVVPAPLDGARILVMEDDPAVLGLIELALEARGAHVTSVVTRADLIATAGSDPGFGAALLDLSPIADDPRGALDELRTAGGMIPVVLISGSPSGVPDVVEDAVKAWVRKPFEMGEVIDVLCTLIATR
jgi:CheY-like chemotaxis protein